MRREALLAGAAGAVVLALAAAAAFAPNIAAAPDDNQVRPSHTAIRDTAFAAEQVGGETVTLSVTTLLEHRGGSVSNVTIVYRMVDAETGLIADRTTRSLGTLQGDREVESNTTLTVERSGDYRLYTFLYEDGRRIDTARSEVRGTSNLVPTYAESAVEFTQFAGASGIPAIQYGVESVSDGRARMTVTAYLTNGGDKAVDGLEVQLVARQADSNIVADSTRVDVGEIRPGRSVTPSAELTVPDNYTYYLDAVLWKDGVIVGSTREVADLNPRRQTGPNTTEVDLDSGEFAAGTETEVADDRPEEPSVTPTESGGQSGLGVALAVVAVGLVGLLARRWAA
ncbi:PGF-CTERM sorting domain-containing protein [Halosegnis sp.]|uniref:DUF7490 domain-containing protein n=1 Tax=Halosegnis sp. TaxID=2864959 RepID=UPI0035D48EE3